MMRSKIPVISFFILLQLVCVKANSQNFSRQVQLQQAKKNGWHKIILTPEVIANSKRHLSDIRLFNSKNDEVPYVVLHQDLLNPYKDSLIYSTVKKETFAIENDTTLKTTLLKFKFEKPQVLDQVVLYIDGPKYYFRDARVFVTRAIDEKNPEKTMTYHYMSFSINSNTITVSSKNKLHFSLNNLTAKDFYIEIENNDNAPLHIIDVQLKQLTPLLIAELKTEEKYTLRFGDPKLGSPRYDISHFVDKSLAMPYLHLGEMEMLVQQEAVAVGRAESYWQKPWFLWSAIGVGAVILFFFSRSLINDMRGKSE